MIVRRQPPVHLTYCLNVHPGETWDANLQAIQNHALKVRERVAPDQPFGLGLRLSRAAAAALCHPPVLEAFRRFLLDHDLYVFTINGFPYGDFHDTEIKQRVYAPDWRTPERLAYTRRLADILASLLPEHVCGTISTVPASYRAWVETSGDVDALVGNLADCAAHLARIENDSGQRIALALEPEPDCLFDTTGETIGFFNTTLEEHPAMLRAGSCWRRYLGVCVDACHLSVQFEDPGEAIRALRHNDINVPKVHLSAALRSVTGAAAARRLAGFDEGTYLHQVRLLGAGGGMLKYPDLTAEALAAVRDDVGGEVRVHVHVPLYFEESEGLHSTATDLSPSFFETVLNPGVPHLEIETYTYAVLPSELAQLSVEESIAKEYQWVLSRLPPS